MTDHVRWIARALRSRCPPTAPQSTRKFVVQSPLVSQRRFQPANHHAVSPRRGSIRLAVVSLLLGSQPHGQRESSQYGQRRPNFFRPWWTVLRTGPGTSGPAGAGSRVSEACRGRPSFADQVLASRRHGYVRTVGPGKRAPGGLPGQAGRRHVPVARVPSRRLRRGLQPRRLRGGSVDDLVTCARSMDVAALYTLNDGEFVSYIIGAPDGIARLGPHRTADGTMLLCRIERPCWL